MKVTRRSAGLLVLLYMVLIGVWTWRFMPRPQAIEVSTIEPTQEKIAAYLAKAPPDIARPALMQLLKMPAEQIHDLAEWVDQPSLTQVRLLTVQEHPLGTLGQAWGEALMQTWLAHAPPVDLLEAHLMVAASGDRLGDATRHEALQILARRALAQGDPAEAVIILGRVCELPEATWDSLQQLTSACRAARTPAPAMHALSLWIQRQKDTGDEAELELARDLEFSLMLEAGNTSEALSHQLSQLIAAAPYSERALDRAYLAARRSHQGSRLLPALERHLATFPEHELSLPQLRQQTELHSDYLRWLGCHAAICDDEQPGPTAFTAYLRLASARVPLALPRLCALATTPAMKTQVEQILTIALNRPDLQLPVLQLAQTDPTARKVLSAQLRALPKNRDLHYAATLAAAAHTTGSTAILWQNFLRRFPGDLPAQRRLIQAHLQEQQPAQALRSYADLPTQALTDEDRQQQALLKQL